MTKSQTVLMLAAVLRPLPTAKHHAWVCSAGSKGYCATKEMLQNGMPGHTLLIESGDLRDVDASGEDGCLLTYCFTEDSIFTYSDHVPSTVSRLTVYGNITSIPQGFLARCTGLTALDLSPLSQVTEVHGHFLAGCCGLSIIDLSPLSNVKEVHGYFLRECTGLTTLDLGPLSQLREVQESFLRGCTGLTDLDLSPLSHVTEVPGSFLMGCSGLTSLDLSPLSRVVGRKVLP